MSVDYYSASDLPAVKTALRTRSRYRRFVLDSPRTFVLDLGLFDSALVTLIANAN
jgi:hypothetical protein